MSKCNDQKPFMHPGRNTSESSDEAEAQMAKRAVKRLSLKLGSTSTTRPESGTNAA